MGAFARRSFSAGGLLTSTYVKTSVEKQGCNFTQIPVNSKIEFGIITTPPVFAPAQLYFRPLPAVQYKIYSLYIGYFQPRSGHCSFL